MALGLHRAGASLLLLATSPARAAALAQDLASLSIRTACTASPGELDAAPTDAVLVSTAATGAAATRAPQEGKGAVLIEGAD